MYARQVSDDEYERAKTAFPSPKKKKDVSEIEIDPDYIDIISSDNL